ncbi:hypothetical protein IW261DRAFT_1420073 [Armillaria novae-zelandiae]|uniref:Uncharacterized protein n=1 Tax=Armillaria novae-zelandiae TaxID=153914 RepID=A0AA39P7T7_9AGAR|nr:hypothetical protein IW261DRAFT_1420073 [Armillaria novae-zelandiae]
MTAVNVIKSHLAEDSDTSILTHEAGGLMGDVLLGKLKCLSPVIKHYLTCHLTEITPHLRAGTPSLTLKDMDREKAVLLTICYTPAIHHKIMISGNPGWGWEALQLYFLKMELDCLTVWFLSWPMQGWIVQLVARLWNWWHLLLGYSDKSKASTMQPPLHSCEDTFNQVFSSSQHCSFLYGSLAVILIGNMFILGQSCLVWGTGPSETPSQEWLTWWFWIKEPPKSTS